MSRKSKNYLIFFVSTFMLIIIIFTSGIGNFKSVKNVIFLIPDGMSIDGTTLARWYNGGQPLAMDEMACGLVRTYSSDAPIADSAPAATAYATSYKSSTGFIAMLPDKFGMPGVNPVDKDKELSPVATVLEAARLNGKSVGIVSTSETSHATPADFSAHAISRKEMDKIAEQQAYNFIDVIMGGGANYFKADKRADKEDLLKEFKDKGYTYITTKDELNKVNTNKLLALFANGAMSYDLDRQGTDEPSLAEMTSKAIEILSKNKNGFFLMVEGSEIDWAAHANDPVALIGDILAFDKAVKVALDFAKKDKNTIAIVLSDHGNSGITIGNRSTSGDYDKRKLDEFIAPLKKAKLTAEGVEKLIKDDMNIDQIKSLISEYYGISDLTEKETEEIAKYFEMKKAKDPKKPYSLAYVIGPMMADRAFLGFTTNGHTGEEVVLYIYSPYNDKPTGVIENTDIALYIEKVLGLNLNKTNADFFNKIDTKVQEEATTKFNTKYNKNVALVYSDKSDSKNPKLIIIQSDGIALVFPENKNYCIDRDGKILKVFKSVTVFNGNDWFISKEAIDLIK